MRATEILTQLALDLSLANPSAEAKRSLVGKQLRIFLAREEAAGGQQQAANPLKATAGRTLVWLSSDSRTHCDFIVRAHHDDDDDDDDGTTHPSLTEITEAKKNTVDRLTELLQANNNITYRTRAAQILKNLCTHYALDKQVVKQALLPKVRGVYYCLSHISNKLFNSIGCDEDLNSNHPLYSLNCRSSQKCHPVKQSQAKKKFHSEGYWPGLCHLSKGISMKSIPEK